MSRKSTTMTTTVAVRLPDDTYQPIFKLAADLDRSVGWVVRELLREALAARAAQAAGGTQ
jgi:predicted transcriptional regulator